MYDNAWYIYMVYVLCSLHVVVDEKFGGFYVKCGNVAEYNSPMDWKRDCDSCLFH